MSNGRTFSGKVADEVSASYKGRPRGRYGTKDAIFTTHHLSFLTAKGNNKRAIKLVEKKYLVQVSTTDECQ